MGLRSAHDFALVLYLWLLAAAVGDRVLGAARWRRPDALPGLLVAAGLGVALLAAGVLGLSFAGAARSLPVGLLLIATAAAAGAGAAWVSHCFRLVRAAFAHPGRALVAVPAALVFAWVLLASLAPPADWDSLMYHLSVPQAILEHGSFAAAASNAHSGYTGAIHFLYIPLLAFGSFASPAVFSAFSLLFLALACLAVAELADGREAGSLAFALVPTASMFLLVGITARIDVVLAFFVALLSYCVLWLHSEAEPGGLPVVGAVAGATAAVKFHGLAYAAVLATVLCVFLAHAVLRGRMRGGRVFRQAAYGLAAGCVLALPWLARNYAFFQHVLYPFRGVPSVPAWAGGAPGIEAASRGAELDLGSVFADARESFSVLDFFLDPGSLTIEPEGYFYYASAAFLVAPLALFLRPYRASLLLVPALAYVALLLGVSTSTNLRYLAPAFPALIVTGAIVFARATSWFGTRHAQTARIALATLALLPSAWTMLAWESTYHPIASGLGFESSQEYLRLRPNVPAELYAQMRRMNWEDRQLLMLFDSRTFYLPGRALQDNSLRNWPQLVRLGLAERCLEGTGVTNVLLNRETIDYFTRRGADFGPFRLDEWPAFARRCLAEIGRSETHTLYEIRTRG